MWLRLLSVIALLVSPFVEGSIKPRGVSQKNLSLYRPDHPFTCFDKSKTYTFEHVNDDYCDCPDGSDEPGTSACPNGRFYCPNVGYRPKVISSTFVDDGVCDCCDGSDEQLTPGGQSRCPNICESYGRLAREEAERKRSAMEAGHLVYKDFVQKYQQEIGEKRERLKQIETDRAAAEADKLRLQKEKEEVEKLETEAKDQHSKAWEETKAQLKAEKERKIAEEAFVSLDEDHDGFVSMQEFTSHLEFDVDGDGVVSEEEAREHLEDSVPADLTHFLEKVWPHIKDIYRRPGSVPEEPSTTTEPTTVHPDDEEEEEEEGVDEKMAQFTRPPLHRFDDHRQQQHEEEEFKMPEYPEETKTLMEAADKARSAYETARKSYDDIDREYTDLIAITATDFGPNGEYYALRGQCFELDEREYIYKLCPFEKAVQKQKHGHHETNLGRFESWKAEGDSKYAFQAYTHGEGCWNGPARSVNVRVKCGGENQVLSVSEPNRCEYAMEFTTPAACSVPPPPIDHHSFWSDAAVHEDL